MLCFVVLRLKNVLAFFDLRLKSCMRVAWVFRKSRLKASKKKVGNKNNVYFASMGVWSHFLLPRKTVGKVHIFLLATPFLIRCSVAMKFRKNEAESCLKISESCLLSCELRLRVAYISEISQGSNMSKYVKICCFKVIIVIFSLIFLMYVTFLVFVFVNKFPYIKSPQDF